MPNAPVVIHDGSLIIETDQPIDIDEGIVCNFGAPRPFVYRRRRASRNKHVKCVILKKKGKEVHREVFKAKECQIEIWFSVPPEE